ncbi:Transmembrane emp24 domain-containing protein 1 [Clonorchis sinensis]|uniref:Transmembrane emp24 domain-containing protein 1 n=1 Tax=Clonorchis sinensis TaxID=79923 RepID=A0A3R7GE18_CLOSI|nr:Transmembrane emp24 domain-containing protein 1 [Clonorchis sinensis]
MWSNIFSICVCVSLSFHAIVADNEQFSETQSHLQHSLPHAQMQHINSDIGKEQRHATGTEFQSGQPSIDQQRVQQPPQYHEPPLSSDVSRTNDPHRTAPIASQRIHVPPDSQPSQLSGSSSAHYVARPTDTRAAADMNADSPGLQHATVVRHEDQRLPYRQTEFHSESHASSPSYSQQVNVDNIHTGGNVDVRLDLDNQGQRSPAASQLHPSDRFHDQNAKFDSLRSHDTIPPQTFRQHEVHQPSGLHHPEVRTANQLRENRQSEQWERDGLPLLGNDFIHKRASDDHQLNSAPDPYNHFRHSHETDEHQAPRQGEVPQRRLNMPRELQLDDTYVFPSADEDRRGRSLSDDFVSMTLIVSPGIKECVFYVPISNFILDYQVIRGGLIDIGLFVKDPQGEPIATRPPSPDATVSIKVPPHFQLRPYAICFDNRKASYADKHVSFSIDVDLNWDNPSNAERAVIEALRKSSFADAQTEAMDAQYMESWNALSDRMESLFGRLRRIEHLQQKTDNFASVDKALMEANGERVLHGSLVQIFILLTVAGIQTLLIRAFFDFNSRFYRVWFGRRSPTSARC